MCGPDLPYPAFGSSVTVDIADGNVTLVEAGQTDEYTRLNYRMIEPVD
jgi:hypothetical protein